MTAFLAAFAAPNACSLETPCDSTGGMCETGLAAGMRSVGYNFFCGLSVPRGALPSGGGLLCFDTQVGLAPPPPSRVSSTLARILACPWEAASGRQRRGATLQLA